MVEAGEFGVGLVGIPDAGGPVGGGGDDHGVVKAGPGQRGHSPHLSGVAVEAGEFGVGLVGVPDAGGPVEGGGDDDGVVQAGPGQGGHSDYDGGVAVEAGEGSIEGPKGFTLYGRATGTCPRRSANHWLPCTRLTSSNSAALTPTSSPRNGSATS